MTSESRSCQRSECVVCCEEVDPANALRLPCKHCYHAACMNQWASRHEGQDVTCPQCRAPVSQQILQELQKPLSYMDLCVLPLMLLVMILECVGSLLHEGRTNAKRWAWLATDIATRVLSSVCSAALSLETFCGNLYKSIQVLATRTFVQFGIARDILCGQLSNLSNLFYALQTRLIRTIEPKVAALLEWSAALSNTIRKAVEQKLSGFREWWAQPGFLGQALKGLTARAWSIIEVWRNAISRLLSNIAEQLLKGLTVVTGKAKMAKRILSARLCQLSGLAAHLACQFLASIHNAFADVCLWLRQEGQAVYMLIRHCVEVVYALAVRGKAFGVWLFDCVCKAIRALLEELEFFFLAVEGAVIALRALVSIFILQPATAAVQKLTGVLCTCITKMANVTCKGVSHAWRIAAGIRDYLLGEVVLVVVTVCFRVEKAISALMRAVSMAFASVHCFARQLFAVSVEPLCFCHRLLEEVVAFHLEPYCLVSSFSFMMWQQVLFLLVQICDEIMQRMSMFLTAAKEAACALATELGRSLAPHWAVACHACTQWSAFVARCLTQVWQTTQQACSRLLRLVRDVGRYCLQQFQAQLVELARVVCNVVRALSERICHVFVAIYHVVRRSTHRAARCCWQTIRFVWQFVYELLLTICCALRNVVWPRKCGGCKTGFAKYRSFCTTCALDLLVPRCSTCGVGWCKYDSACLSCNIDRTFLEPRCLQCHKGFKKIGKHCLTCVVDQYHSRCAVCHGGYAKIGARCFTCCKDHVLDFPRCETCRRGYAKVGLQCFPCLKAGLPRCGTCSQGYAKIGTRCFSCFKHHLLDLPRCGICRRGYAKIGTRCFSCLKHQMLDFPRCGVCQQGYAKIGTRCFSCLKHQMLDFPRCGVCQQGYAKVGTRCFTCLKHRLLDFPHCGVCRQGYAKIGTRCLSCFKRHMVDFPRCGVCRHGYSKIGSRCVRCFKAHIREMLLNRPCCGVCQRGSAKFGTKCFTCYRKLLLQPKRLG